MFWLGSTLSKPRWSRDCFYLFESHRDRARLIEISNLLLIYSPDTQLLGRPKLRAEIPVWVAGHPSSATFQEAGIKWSQDSNQTLRYGLWVSQATELLHKTSVPECFHFWRNFHMGLSQYLPFVGSMCVAHLIWLVWLPVPGVLCWLHAVLYFEHTLDLFCFDSCFQVSLQVKCIIDWTSHINSPHSIISTQSYNHSVNSKAFWLDIGLIFVKMFPTFGRKPLSCKPKLHSRIWVNVELPLVCCVPLLRGEDSLVAFWGRSYM